AVMAFGWLLGVAIHAPSRFTHTMGGFDELFPPSLLLSGSVGYSRQYKIPTQSIVGPRIDGHAMLGLVIGVAIPVLIVVAMLSVIAVGQWFVLRSRFSVSPAWIPATVVAMLISETLVMLVGQIYLELMLLAALVGGALVGGAQYLVIRSHLGTK